MRKLIYIPAWHNRVDWGVDKLTKTKQCKIVSIVENMPEVYWQIAEIYWDVVEDALTRLDSIDWTMAQIFSDTISEVSEPMLNIIEETAKKGSRHMKLIVALLKLGAKLEVTEDKNLLINYGSGEIHDTAHRELKERDEVIAQNINDRLQKHGYGILILGISHKGWRNRIDPDINIQDLLNTEDINKLEEKMKQIK